MKSPADPTLKETVVVEQGLVRRVFPRPRALLLLAACLLAAAVPSGLLFAQEEGEEEFDAALAFARAASDSAQAPEDSLAAPEDSSGVAQDSLTAARSPQQAFLDSLAALQTGAGPEEGAWISPFSYGTEYRLNRTTSTWDQRVGFQFSARGISVSTQSSGTVYGDTETKSDRRNNTTNLSINYAASQRLSVGLDLNLSRHNDRFLNQRFNTDRVGANAVYSWQESPDFSATVTASAGSVDEVKPTHEGSGTTSSLAMDSKFSFGLPCTVAVNASGSLGNKRSQDVRTSLKTHDKDLKEQLGASLTLTPLKSASVRVGFKNSNDRVQYPLAGQQETWTSKATVMDAALNVSTWRGIAVTTAGRYTDKDVDYDVDQSRSNTYLSKAFSAQLDVPSLMGASLRSKFDADYANSVMGTGRDGDINTKALSGRIQRSLTSSISSELAGNISLVQYFFYDEGSMNDERDIYKDALSLSLNLGSSGSRYRGSAKIKRDIEKMVYVRPVNSGNNRTSELYSASASFTYTRGSIAFTQRASATSDYTLFHFSESQNVLSRTTSISSTLDFPWSKKASFRLSHTYRIQDRGSYTTPEGYDQAFYSRTGGSVTEELYLTTSYNITSWISASLKQRYQVSKNFTFEAGEKRTSPGRKLLELLNEVSVRYDFGESSSAEFSVSKTHSAFGTSFLNARAKFSKEFF
ncbi:MAG: hypothetical protein AMJ46_02465 [Latescibacteria bacterium DG_63]|nr:MAG: hypothetical protein AMJ46_02465 [Latescibacteria bacterium DG_63]